MTDRSLAFPSALLESAVLTAAGPAIRPALLLGLPLLLVTLLLAALMSDWRQAPAAGGDAPAPVIADAATAANDPPATATAGWSGRASLTRQLETHAAEAWRLANTRSVHAAALESVRRAGIAAGIALAFGVPLGLVLARSGPRAAGGLAALLLALALLPPQARGLLAARLLEGAAEFDLGATALSHRTAIHALGSALMLIPAVSLACWFVRRRLPDGLSRTAADLGLPVWRAGPVLLAGAMIPLVFPVLVACVAAAMLDPIVVGAATAAPASVPQSLGSAGLADIVHSLTRGASNGVFAPALFVLLGAFIASALALVWWFAVPVDLSRPTLQRGSRSANALSCLAALILIAGITLVFLDGHADIAGTVGKAFRISATSAGTAMLLAALGGGTLGLLWRLVRTRNATGRVQDTAHRDQGPGLPVLVLVILVLLLGPLPVAGLVRGTGEMGAVALGLCWGACAIPFCTVLAGKCVASHGHATLGMAAFHALRGAAAGGLIAAALCLGAPGPAGVLAAPWTSALALKLDSAVHYGPQTAALALAGLMSAMTLALAITAAALLAWAQPTTSSRRAQPSSSSWSS